MSWSPLPGGQIRKKKKRFSTRGPIDRICSLAEKKKEKKGGEIGDHMHRLRQAMSGPTSTNLRGKKRKKRKEGERSSRRQLLAASEGTKKKKKPTSAPRSRMTHGVVREKKKGGVAAAQAFIGSATSRRGEKKKKKGQELGYFELYAPAVEEKRKRRPS